jgi:hypothetical protein
MSNSMSKLVLFKEFTRLRMFLLVIQTVYLARTRLMLSVSRSVDSPTAC